MDLGIQHSPPSVGCSGSLGPPQHQPLALTSSGDTSQCRGEHKTFLEAECSQSHVGSGRTAGFLCTCAPFSTMAFSPQPKTMVEALVDPRY